jgi:membrane associated rhomboid family serine protease
MIQAPVGWQCPECVRAGARRSRVTSYRPGAPGRAGGIGAINLRGAYATIALVAVNVVVFVATGFGDNASLDKYGLVPVYVQQGQLYRLFTSPFLHLSITHIGLNMLSLVIIGPPVEAAVGRTRYLLLYAGAAMGGSVCYYLIAPSVSLAVGASGAIFGVFGAYFVIARWRGLQTGGIVALIAINLVFGFVEPNIGWQAHLGGLVIGAAMALGFVLAERRPPVTARALEVATCVAVSVVLLGLMQLPART